MAGPVTRSAAKGGAGNKSEPSDGSRVETGVEDIGVEMTRVTAYPWTPVLAALELFHPMLLLRNLLFWASVDCRVLTMLVVTVCVLPLAMLFAVPLALAAAAAVTLGLGRKKKNAPLIITPRTAATANVEFLVQYVSTHRPALKAAVASYGAVMFRGFGMGEVETFEQVLEAANMKPTEFFGQAPRKQEPGWKYVFRNVAFEAAAEPQTMYTRFKRVVGVVWSWNPAWFNFHNEMAYLDPQHHLGKYGVFASRFASEIGGFTPLADARAVHRRLARSLPRLPVAMRWALSRKKRQPVPRKASGGYVDYLLGNFELEGVPDQFWPTRKVSEIHKLARELNLEVEDSDPDKDIVVFSKWICPSRQVEGSSASDVTWWCNGNHTTIGSQGPVKDQLPFWFRFEDGSERPATWREIYTISYAYWMEATYTRWEQGDLLIFDNQLMTHDATPGTGKRMIMPTFGDCF